MGYDSGVKVNFTYGQNQTEINFLMPLQYMWDSMSNEDAYEFSKELIRTGRMTEPLIEAIKWSDHTGEEKELKEKLISHLDEFKESYINDVNSKNNYTWWSIGRGIDKFMSIIFPERKFNYSTDTERERFFIIDSTKSEDPKEELVIDIINGTVSVDNSPSNEVEFERYIKDFADKIKRQQEDYKNYDELRTNYWKVKDDLHEANKTILKLENKLKEYECIEDSMKD